MATKSLPGGVFEVVPLGRICKLVFDHRNVALLYNTASEELKALPANAQWTVVTDDSEDAVLVGREPLVTLDIDEFFKHQVLRRPSDETVWLDSEVGPTDLTLRKKRYRTGVVGFKFRRHEFEVDIASVLTARSSFRIFWSGPSLYSMLGLTSYDGAASKWFLDASCSLVEADGGIGFVPVTVPDVA